MRVLREIAVHERCELGEVVVRAAKCGNPNEKCGHCGETALTCAVRQLRIEIIKGLIIAGALVDDTHVAIARSFGTADGDEAERVIQRESAARKTKEFGDCMALLPKLQCFAALQPSELPSLAMSCTFRQYQAGDIVVQQGESGHELFMICFGSVAVLVEGTAEGASTKSQEKVAVLKAGQYFGEAALLNNAPRNATIESLTRLEVYVLSRDSFNKLGLRYRLASLRKNAVIQRTRASGQNMLIEPSIREKTDDDRDLIRAAMRANKNLAPLVENLDDQRLALIADQAFRLDVREGAEVVRQRDLKADLFYVVQRGQLDVFKDGEKVGELGPGTSFGELALIFRAPRAATVTASSNAALWALRRHDLRAILQAPLKAKVEEFARVVEQIPLLKDAPDKDLVASALVETAFACGESIIRQGEAGRTLFILREGEVAVDVDGKEVCRMVAQPRSEKVQVFGERALLSDEPRAATVKVVSPAATVLALDSSIFALVMAASGVRDPSAPKSGMVKYSLDELEFLGALGNGSFGRVTLVRCRKTGQTFAHKRLSKGHVVDVGAQENVMNEQRILRMTDCPFVVRLAATFETHQELSFLMEPMMGGDLFGLYGHDGFDGSEPHCRFYSACVVLAFEHLHACQIVYRDLKPENLLLDHKGLLKVADFGLAKFVFGLTYTTCGTPCYFAPEMISGQGHAHAVDWWALGVLIYELMIGDTPFSAVDIAHILRRVQGGIGQAFFPEPDASWAQLVHQLCAWNPQRRLPMRPGGIENILQHDWFADAAFDWEALRAGRLPALFVPSVRGAEDRGNFEDRGDEPPNVCFDGVDTTWCEGFEDPWGPRFDGR